MKHLNRWSVAAVLCFVLLCAVGLARAVPAPQDTSVSPSPTDNSPDNSDPDASNPDNGNPDNGNGNASPSPTVTIIIVTTTLPTPEPNSEMQAQYQQCLNTTQMAYQQNQCFQQAYDQYQNISVPGAQWDDETKKFINQTCDDRCDSPLKRVIKDMTYSCSGLVVSAISNATGQEAWSNAEPIAMQMLEDVAIFSKQVMCQRDPSDPTAYCTNKEIDLLNKYNITGQFQWSWNAFLNQTNITDQQANVTQWNDLLTPLNQTMQPVLDALDQIPAEEVCTPCLKQWSAQINAYYQGRVIPVELALQQTEAANQTLQALQTQIAALNQKCGPNFVVPDANWTILVPPTNTSASEEQEGDATANARAQVTSGAISTMDDFWNNAIRLSAAVLVSAAAIAL